MAEEQARKKKSKRKGLGGLDPEKKKKLKVGFLRFVISREAIGNYEKFILHEMLEYLLI